MWLYYKLFIHLYVDGHVGCFEVLAITNKIAVNIDVQVFIWADIPFISFGQIPRNGMARSRDRYMFTLLRNCQTFQSGCNHLLLPAVYVSSGPFTSSPMTCIVSLFNFSHCSRCVLVSHCDYHLHFSNDIGHLLMCLFAVHVSSLVNCQHFCSFLNWIVYFIIQF